MTTNARDLSDADLEAALGTTDLADGGPSVELEDGDDEAGDEGTGEAATTPAGEEPAAEPAPQDQQPATTAATAEDDGPGNRAEALRQERELRRQAETRLREYEAAEAKRLAAQREEEVEARYEELLVEHGQEAANAFLRQVQDERANEREAALQQQAQLGRIDASEELAREYLGDEKVDAVIAAFERLQADPLLGGVINVQAIAASKNPFRMISQLVDRFSGTGGAPAPAGTPAAGGKAGDPVEAEVQRRLGEALAKLQQPPQGHRTVGLGSSATNEPAPKKRARDKSDAELEESLKA